MTKLETYPPSIILWRALLQWLGGIGIIVTAIAILPSLKVGGMQLFHMESSDTSDKFLPRIGDIAKQIVLVYIGLTAICAGLYRVTGMNEFQAVTLAMTTLSAGGFANSNSSFAPFVATGADFVAIPFMTFAALPFTLWVMLLHGNWRAIFRDPQPLVWLAIAWTCIFAATLYISDRPDLEIGPEGPLRAAAFSVISVMSGTGFGTTDFSLWGPFTSAIFIFVMFVGGCAGSAAGGLKAFRMIIGFKLMGSYAKTMTRPHVVAPVRYSRKQVKPDTLQSIMLFIYLYLVTFAVSGCLLALAGLDAEAAISSAATMLGNVGPGLGETVGPAGTFQSLNPFAKWVCVITMLLGRLELISVFVILSPSFWRN